MTDFLHGVEVVEIQSGVRPIRTAKSSVIGLVGSAPKGPLNTPTLIAGDRAKGVEVFGSEAAGIGTIPDALKAIFAQTGATVVVVNVLDVTADKAAVAATRYVMSDGQVTLAHRYALDLVVKSDGNLPPAGVASGTVMTDYTLSNNKTLTHVDGGVLETATAVYITFTDDGVPGGEDRTAVAGGPWTLTTPTGTVVITGVYVGKSAEVTYAEGSDYSYNADTGVVTRPVGSAIDADQALQISYDRIDDTAVSASDIVGGVDAGTGAYSGITALVGAQSALGVAPKIIIAPGYSSDRSVGDALLTVANRLRATVPIEGPSTTDGAAIALRGNYGSRRAYLVDPDVRIADPEGGDTPVSAPSSAFVAGVIARSDSERGFWWSPSNRLIRGILGTARPIDFSIGDKSARANILNENEVATIIREKGYRLWGNRTCSSDPKWAFLSVVRTADLLSDALLRSHLWAVDRNISRTYFEDVAGGVNAYIRNLVGREALVGGRCYPTPDLNTAESLADGRVYFDIDFTPPPPAERITFRTRLTNEYLDILAPAEDVEAEEEEN